MGFRKLLWANNHEIIEFESVFFTNPVGVS